MRSDLVRCVLSRHADRLAAVGWSICNTAYARSFDLLKLVEVFEIIGRHELLF
jgi:hypothetical protein